MLRVRNVSGKTPASDKLREQKLNKSLIARKRKLPALSPVKVIETSAKTDKTKVIVTVLFLYDLYSMLKLLCSSELIYN